VGSDPVSVRPCFRFLNEKRYAMEALIPDKKIKDLFKQAIIEAIEEKKELFHDLLLEVMEDLAMVRAIQDGENSGPAKRNEIFQILLN